MISTGKSWNWDYRIFKLIFYHKSLYYYGNSITGQTLDKLRELGYRDKLQSKSKSVPDSFIESTFFPDASRFIYRCCQKVALYPENMLEVGVSLGRICYELIKLNPSLSEITVVEPFQRLLSCFKKIIIDGGEYDFSYIKCVNELERLSIDTRKLSQECKHIRFECINKPFVIDTLSNQYDMVLCLNVLDQCESPTMIVNGLMERTKPNGILALSCSYQWSKKHLSDFSEAIDNINDYFSSSWLKIEESEFNYKFRFNERYSRMFLSHVVVYKKL